MRPVLLTMICVAIVAFLRDVEYNSSIKILAPVKGNKTIH